MPPVEPDEVFIGPVLVEKPLIEPIAATKHEIIKPLEKKQPKGVKFKPQANSSISANKELVIKWANHYGVSADLLVRIVDCESGFNANAVNKRAVIVGGKNYGHAKGLFQFIDSTWVGFSVLAGRGGASVFDADANAQVGAWAFANGKSGHWQCK